MIFYNNAQQKVLVKGSLLESPLNYDNYIWMLCFSKDSIPVLNRLRIASLVKPFQLVHIFLIKLHQLPPI